MKKWSRFFYQGTRSPIFRCPKMGFGVPEMVARRGKCPKNHFFCISGLLLYKYKIYQVGQEFRKLFDILVHPTFHWSVYTVVPRSTLLKMISFNVSPLRNPSLQISRKHSEVWRHFPPFIEMFTKDFMIFTGPRCLWGLVYGSRSLYLCHSNTVC